MRLEEFRRAVEALPEQHDPPRNGSIDFGRGYSAAVKDVLALLTRVERDPRFDPAVNPFVV